MSDNLTVINPKLEAMRAMTIPGMAHWAGSGPKGKYCGECAFYTMKEVGVGRSPRCGKYADMMGNYGTKRLPQNTPACKYFVEREKA